MSGSEGGTLVQAREQPRIHFLAGMFGGERYIFMTWAINLRLFT